MSKAIIEFEKIPESCLQCPISNYECGDFGENLFCPLLEQEGNFLQRLSNCPIKIREKPRRIRYHYVVNGAALAGIFIGLILGFTIGFLVR